MMIEKKQRWVFIAITASLILFFTITLAIFYFRAGIRVKVANTGTAPLRSVVLHVTGASYSVGDIAPGASIEEIVKPTSESHLEIEFKDTEGQVQLLNAGGYFEPDYSGTIRVYIKDGKIEKNEQDIRL